MEGHKRKIYLDVIRALAAVLIVLYHFDVSGLDYNLPYFYGYANGNWGNVGVFLFFMISGCALMDRYGDDFRVWDFYKKRFLRIFPTFWLCYAIFFLVNFWETKSIPALPVSRLALTVLGMDGYFSYRMATFYILGEWFLGCIILIYLLFPIVRVCMKKNIHVTTAVLLVLSGLVYYNDFFGMFQIPAGRNLIVAMFYFVFGVWLEKVFGILKKKLTIDRKYACFLGGGGFSYFCQLTCRLTNMQGIRC